MEEIFLKMYQKIYTTIYTLMVENYTKDLKKGFIMAQS